jgi:hypothetical protein
MRGDPSFKSLSNRGGALRPRPSVESGDSQILARPAFRLFYLLTKESAQIGGWPPQELVGHFYFHVLMVGMRPVLKRPSVLGLHRSTMYGTEQLAMLVCNYAKFCHIDLSY